MSCTEIGLENGARLVVDTTTGELRLVYDPGGKNPDGTNRNCVLGRDSLIRLIAVLIVTAYTRWPGIERELRSAIASVPPATD